MDSIFFEHINQKQKSQQIPQEKKDNRPFSESIDSQKLAYQKYCLKQNLSEPFDDSKNINKDTNIVNITNENKYDKTEMHDVLGKDKEIENKKNIDTSKKIDKVKSIFGGTITRLKKIKHIEFYIAGIAIGLMLLIYFSASIFGSGATVGSSSSTEKQVTYDQYIVEREQKITTMVRQMKGVGNADVAIHFESSIEYIFAVMSTENSNGKTETPMLVTENGVTKPIIVKEIYPKALGVVIVCEGANNSTVRIAVIDAVSIMLNLTKEKIVVTTMR